MQEVYTLRRSGATAANTSGRRKSVIKSDPKKRPYLRVGQAAGRYDVWGNPRTNVEVWAALKSLPDDRIREAVQKTLPRCRQEYSRGLTLLAGHLRAIDPSDHPGSWQEVLDVWFFLARPMGREYRREWVGERFAERFSASAAKPGEAIRRAVVGAGWGKVADFAKALRLIAGLLGRRVFYLSARSAAEWLGVSFATAARRLRALVTAGNVRVVSEGQPHLYDRNATVYDVSPMYALCDRAARPEPPEPPPISFGSLAAERLCRPVKPYEDASPPAEEGVCISPLCVTDQEPHNSEENQAWGQLFDWVEKEQNRSAADCPPTCPGCNWCQFWGKD